MLSTILEASKNWNIGSGPERGKGRRVRERERKNAFRQSLWDYPTPLKFADVCRQIPLVQRFTLFTFSTRTQNCQFRDLFKIISPTTFPTVSGIFTNSIQGQLAPRELPRNQALLEIYYGSGGATGHGKDLKIRSAPFLFTLSLPLCFCVLKFFMIFASRLPSKISRSEQIKRKFSARKDRKKTWFWLAASNQNATVISNQILRLSSVRVRQTNNDCAQAYLSLCSPFSILGSSSFSLARNHFCLNPLSISSSRMATEQHRDTMYVWSAGYSFVRLVIYKHLRETGSKIAYTITWEGQVILFFE